MRPVSPPPTAASNAAPARWSLPGALVRRSGGRVIGGVAGGLSDHLGVDVLKVRLTFVVLTVLGFGAGAAAYGMLWVFTSGGPDTEAPRASERRQAYGLAIVGLALTAAFSALVHGSSGWLVPIGAVAAGAALVWREFDTQGAGRLSVLPARLTTLTWVRILGGATLIVLGLGVIVLARVNFGSLGPALIAVAVTLVGVGLLTVPLWLRLVRALNAERAARIRNEEREEIASHLHDSVLQTLALIQRQADNSTEVVRLARGQERELRTWLFSEPETAHAGPAAALRQLVGEIEDQHGVTVTLVTVGDLAVGGLSAEQLTAVLGATREAVVNAAKHAEVTQIDLYAEAEPHQVSVFVRDRGVGFDPTRVSADRHGLAKSIRGRVERRGGRAEIRSSPGSGTEVRITMPIGRGEDKAS